MIMARDKLGELKDSDFERDFTDIPDIARAYKPGFMQGIMAGVSAKVGRARSKKARAQEQRPSTTKRVKVGRRSK